MLSTFTIELRTSSFLNNTFKYETLDFKYLNHNLNNLNKKNYTNQQKILSYHNDLVLDTQSSS